MLRRRDLKALHAARERELVVGFDDQVYMRALDAEVHDMEVCARCDRIRSSANRVVRAPAAQVADGLDDTQHDMDWVASRQRGTHAMRSAGAMAFGLTACMPTFTTAQLGRCEEWQLLGHSELRAC
jgi:hypothetical protein